MFNVGDRIRVYKTNWGPKKTYIGHEYIISEVRCGKDTATTYILSRPSDCDSPTGACCHVWYDSELGLVRTAADELAKFDNKVLLNSIYGKQATPELYISTRNPYRNDAISAMLEAGNFAKYIKNDVKRTEEMWSMFFSTNPIPKIKNVIFNDPATIVFWADGTKTVVKAQNDDWFDPEKGLAMAISKKALGNKGNYCNELKKWLPKEEPDIDWFDIDVPDFAKAFEYLRQKLLED